MSVEFKFANDNQERKITGNLKKYFLWESQKNFSLETS